MKLSELNIGDSVTVFSNCRISEITKIERKTKTLIITNSNRKFNINTGNSVPVGNGFYFVSITPTTDEHRRVIHRSNMISKLRDFPFRSLSDEQLENVMKAISNK